MTGHERIAAKNIRGAIHWIVGGYYNAYQDGYDEYVPKSKQSIIEEVYDAVMSDAYGYTFNFGRAPREMRFAGKEFIMNYITKKINEDEDVAELAEHYGWTN